MSRNAARKISHLVPFWKIGSGDLQDYLLLDELIKTKKPIIISTGMVSLSELDEVYNYIKGKDSFVSILYCVSEYPCPREKFNLLTITNFQEKYPNTIIGFSDHSLGFEPSLAAVNLGARIIEKHFTLSRDFWGSDHKVSLIPSEMKKMVSQIRNRSFGNISVNKFHGEKYRELEGSQNKYRPYFEKKLVAACDISKGSVIDKEMLYAMRPAKLIPGLFANETMNVIGKKSKIKIKKYEPISAESLCND